MSMLPPKFCPESPEIAAQISDGKIQTKRQIQKAIEWSGMMALTGHSLTSE